MSFPSRRLITEATKARLIAVTGRDVYVGEVPEKVRVIENDPTGRVVPYVFFVPTGGTPHPDVDLGDANTDLVYTAHITAVAAYVADLDNLIDVIHAGMYRWAPVLAGVSMGSFRPPEGYDPGPHRKENDVSPPRFSSPLIYQLAATTN